MYQNFYGFKERPFTLLPDPGFLFLNEKHRAALDMLEAAVSGRSGFCVISGEIGAGKTTLIRELLNRLDETVCVGLVSNTHPSFGELLQWIMAAYGLPCGSEDTIELHKRFLEFVNQQHAQNKLTLLIIDEAQNLTVQGLEELRMLSNVNSDNDLLLQVILVGQQQLRDRLQQPELEQFSQGIALNYHLEALNEDETCRYIQHRVSHAGGESGLFSADACQAVYRLSGGIPRLINRLCDLSLVYGCTAKSRVITAGLVNRVGEEQHMSALYGIPQVDRVTAKPEHTVPPMEASTERKAVPGKTEKADKSSSNTIVGALSPVLFPEIANETSAPSELHQLVVDAEQKKRTRGGRGVLWLLLGVVVIAGGTGWLMRDFRNADPAPSIATTQPPAVAKEGSVAPTTTADSQLTKPEAERAAEAERLAEQRNAGLRREAEKITRLKQESDRLERERRAAEKKLAKQRAARIELEREADLERRKMAEAREAAKKLAEQRTRAEARLSEAAAAKSSAAQELARRSKARASFLETEPSAYDEEDGDDIVLNTKASLAGKTGSIPEAEQSAYDEDDGDAIIRDTKASFGNGAVESVKK